MCPKHSGGGGKQTTEIACKKAQMSALTNTLKQLLINIVLM